MAVGNGGNTSKFPSSLVFRQKRQVSYGSVEPLQRNIDLLKHAVFEIENIFCISGVFKIALKCSPTQRMLQKALPNVS